MHRPIVTAVLLGLGGTACRNSDAKFDPWSDEDEAQWSEDTGTAADDGDRDGWTDDEDCDDGDPEVNPGAEELCDGIDNNCDGEIDEGVQLSLYVDSDGDGYGDQEAELLESCEELPGYETVGGDCDDTSSEVYPGAPEQCDELDNDCNGEIDEGLAETWYDDADNDG